MTNRQIHSGKKVYEFVPDHEVEEDIRSTTESFRSAKSAKVRSCFSYCWKNSFGNIGEDWVFLASLGLFMGTISFALDYGIWVNISARSRLYSDLLDHPFLRYLAWISIPLCLILFSTNFTYLVAPQAAGSGIPELKTILRGVVLKESLSYRALITKIIGLTATLGTGLPLGKEGPFVHIATMTASLLSKAVTSFKGIYENKSRNSDMLGAACAVGVAAAFAAPVGGVLFSIEVTTAFFAVRNYWRGFFVAVCGTVMFRLLAVWFHNEATLTALFRTEFKVDRPFAPMELFVFILLGVLCGFLGALFVWVDRKYKTFLKTNRFMKLMTKKSMMIYPAIVTLFYSTLTFPLGIGMFSAGELTTHQQVVEMFSNFSWMKENPSVHEFSIIEHWRTPWTGIFFTLICFILIHFVGTILASTLPVPAGIFIPTFKMGAALGRILGETMALIFANELTQQGNINPYILPGGYAIAGAAALAGAVTHTVSSSVIVFELTGQITHSIPVMIAVLISNGVAQLLQPSIFDSIIVMKKLPYLPDIISTSSSAYKIFVEDFMIRDVNYIWYGITYKEVETILTGHKKIKTYPIVDSTASMVLLGSVSQKELLELLEAHIGQDRKARIFNQWIQLAEKELEEELMLEGSQDDTKSFGSQGYDRDEDESSTGSKTPPPKTTFPFRFPSFRQKSLTRRQATSVNDVNLQSSYTPRSNIASNVPSEPVDTPTGPVKKSSPDDSPTKEVQLSTESPVIIPENSSTTEKPEVHQKLSMGSGVPANLSERRPSRFSVTKVENSSLIAKLNGNASQEQSNVSKPDDTELSQRTDEPKQMDTLQPEVPRKSILKKTKSFHFQPTRSLNIKSSVRPPYATIHGGESGGFRGVVANLMRTRSLAKTDSKSSQLTFTGISKAGLPIRRLRKKIADQERRWVEEEMNKVVNFDSCQIDPAPHQLVERTNLLKVHTIFSMMGLNHAYVTAIGRLIGVVSLKELRRAIENTNSGDFLVPSEHKQ